MDQAGGSSDPRSIGVYPTFVAGVTAAAKNFLPLFGVYLFLGVPMVVMLTLGCPTIFGMMVVARAGVSIEHIVIPAHEWIALAGSILFAMGVGSWTYAAAYHMADRVLAGEPCPGVGAAYGAALERVPAFIGTYVCMITLTFAGVMFFILPGIYAAIALYLAPVRAVARGRNPLEAIADSFALIKGRWWRVCGFTLLIALCIQAIYLPVSLPMAWLVSARGGMPTWFIPLTISLSMLLGIFQLVCSAALHRRLEGLGPVGMPQAPPMPEDTAAGEPG